MIIAAEGRKRNRSIIVDQTDIVCGLRRKRFALRYNLVAAICNLELS